MRTRTGRAPGTAGITARIFVRGVDIVATIRLGAAPLHRRAYKQDTGPGTLHPPLAAALAQLAAPTAGEHVLDPFCGDGTIAIETALAFPGTQVSGSDIDGGRLTNAARNAARAGVDVLLRHADASQPTDTTVDVIPPWDLSVKTTGSLAAFWGQLPHRLTNGGRIAAIADSDMDVPSTLEKHGFVMALATQIRLAGRMSHLVLAAKAGDAQPLPEELSSWREQAMAAGIVTATGF
jgi:tRNA (guanine6-N2)-methyltransferase